MLEPLLINLLGLTLARPTDPVGVTSSRKDCEGESLPICAAGVTGPTCEFICIPGKTCDYSLCCHGWGGTYGLSIFGSFLFGLDAESYPWVVSAKLLEFIITHHRSLGLKPGIKPGHLGLAPHHDFRSQSGGLFLLKYDQDYRGVPVFGPDDLLKIVATRSGVLGIRGALVDGRDDFAHYSAQCSKEIADSSIRLHVAERTGKGGGDLQVDNLRVVAVPRVKALGWAADVEDGLEHVATVVIEADPKSGNEPRKLLYFNEDVSAALADEVDVNILAEDRTSDVFTQPVTATAQSLLANGEPIRASTKDGLVY